MASTLGSLVLVARDRILEALALITPISPLVGPQGTPGATAYSYQIVALNVTGHSAASVAGVTATGHATLDGTNFNRLNWTPVTRATGYQVYRSVGGATQGLIATLGDVTTLDDIGLAGDATTAPTENTSGTLGIFWSDAELLGIMILGAKDLWRAFIDLHQEHFFTVADGSELVDPTDVRLAASTGALSGIPTNVHRILLIAPRDTTPSSQARAVTFTPKDYNSVEFQNALARDAVDPSNATTIYYAVTGAGAPIGAPTIYVAPQVTTAIPLRLVYIPTLSGALVATDLNPVPGESDAALIAYTVAFALAKQREDNSPDANWIAIYGTEKNSCLVAAAPRQEQAPSVVEGVFDHLTGSGLTGDQDDW